ncbi:MAG TPA: hypothetical protein DCE42_25390 [Myxococcales bacterium]|nr:hypothetical protein [Myxococcales bacterium]
MTHLDIQDVLGIPVDLLEEIAVVTCDACISKENKHALMSHLSPVGEHYDVGQLGSAETIARRRVKLAHAIIAVEGCTEGCAQKVLQTIKRPQAIFNIAPDSTYEDIRSDVHQKMGQLRRQAFQPVELYQLDCKGLRCPMPITKLSSFAANLPPGSQIEVEATDPTFMADVQSWCAQKGHTLESLEPGAVTRALVSLALPELLAELPAESSDEIVFEQVIPPPATLPMTETLDCVGLSCPMPIIKLSKKAKQMNGGVLEIQADDPAFPSDLEAWCGQTDATFEWLSTKQDKIHRALLTLPQPRPTSGIISLPKEAFPVAPPAQTQPKARPIIPLETAQQQYPIHEVLDYRALRSPMQIAKLQKALSRHETSGIIRIERNDPQFQTDLENWSKQSGHQILSFDAQADSQKASVLIKKSTPEEELFSDEAEFSDEIEFSNQLDLASHFGNTESLEQSGSIDTSNISDAFSDSDFAEPSFIESILESSGEFFAEEVLTPEPLMSVEVLDFRGLRCPMPILRLTKALKQSDHPSYEVLADDPAFPADLEAWCTQQNFTIQSIEPTAPFSAKIVSNAQLERSVTANKQAAQTPSPRPRTAVLASTEKRQVTESYSALRLPHTGNMLRRADTPSESHVSTSSPAPPISFETLDFTGLKCPMPIVKLTKAVQQHTGSRFRVIADDPAFPADIKAWCEHRDFKIIEVIEDALGFTALIEDTKAVDSPPEQKEETITYSPSVWELELPEESLAGLPSLSEGDLVALDYRGLRCPLPIVRLSQASHKHPNRSLEVIADDPAFPADLKAWCEIHPFDVEEEEESGGSFRVVLRRKP